MAVVTVAREPGVSAQRITAAREAIEQGRLAYIRATDQRDGRLHRSGNASCTAWRDMTMGDSRLKTLDRDGVEAAVVGLH